MAGRGTAMEKGRRMEGLLLKLREGQDALKKSMEELKPLPEHGVLVAEDTRHLLDVQKLEKISRDSLMRKLDKVADFPRKRARLDQLTVNFEGVGVKKLDCFILLPS